MAKQMHEVELTVEERYALARMQPTKGNFITMTMTKNLISLLELHPDEAEEWGFIEAGRGRWVPKPIEDEAGTVAPGDQHIFESKATLRLSGAQFAAIAATLEAANKAGTLETLHLRPYNLFVRKPARDEEDAAEEEAGGPAIHAVQTDAAKEA